MRILCEPLLKGLEFFLALVEEAGLRIEGSGYLTDLFDVARDFRLCASDLLEAAVEASCQTCAVLVGKAPLWRSRLCWMEARTWRREADIRSPGGSRGPPWSLLRIPRTAEQ